MMTVSYNWALVLISFVIAVLASFTALDLAGHIARAKGIRACLWVLAGALAMGIGEWAMHFVGMLAMSLPIPLGYDRSLTLLSLLLAVLSSAIALSLAGQAHLPAWQLGAGALVMGCGIAAMHYVGMQALKMPPGILYESRMYGLSVLVAVLASGAALWAAFRLRRSNGYSRLVRAIAALLMGLAITGTHYIGIAAAHFPLGSFCGAARTGLQSNWLAMLIACAALGIILVVLLAAVLDERLGVRTAQLDESLEANHLLSRLALQDSLTCLPNRLMLEQGIHRMIARAQQRTERFALLFLDLDGFKPINDAFGHQVGDEVLRSVATLLQAGRQQDDLLARVGGDEFVLLVPLSEPEEAMRVAGQLVARLAEPIQVAGEELTLSASIGVALYPEHGQNEHELLINADAAMYQAKRSGKNAYRRFDASMHSDAHYHLRIARELRLALAQRQFTLHYQPKFDAHSLEPVGVEALLRWQHPQRGLVMPGDFIDVAERSGQIIAIGEWVLDQACQQMSQWHRQGLRHWRMAVNLSAMQFGHPGLVACVAAALQRHQLPANALTLEITETVALQDAEASRALLRQLAEMGVDLSIDDFGTGYSSLLYLQRLPANELKIDRGFIQDLAEGRNGQAIVAAIIDLGHTLGLRVVGEGVETPFQRDALKALGCDVLQGYLLGKPQAAEHVMKPAALRKALP